MIGEHIQSHLSFFYYVITEHVDQKGSKAANLLENRGCEIQDQEIQREWPLSYGDNYLEELQTIVEEEATSLMVVNAENNVIIEPHEK